jgi:hypothetical protein
MSLIERTVHRTVLSIIYAAFNWMIVNWLIIELPFWKYLIIELFLVISMKFYIFTTRKIQLI